jgi:hypothetical protein
VDAVNDALPWRARRDNGRRSLTASATRKTMRADGRPTTAAATANSAPDHARTAASDTSSQKDERPDMTAKRGDGFQTRSDGAAGARYSAARLSLHAVLRVRSKLVAVDDPMHSLAGWLAIIHAEPSATYLQENRITRPRYPHAPRPMQGKTNRARRSLLRTTSRPRLPYLRANWMSLRRSWEVSSTTSSSDSGLRRSCP